VLLLTEAFADYFVHRRFDKSQIPPDLVVKFQRVDFVDVILWGVLRLHVVYQREIKG